MADQHDPRSGGADPLDDLLRSARWPEPSPLQMARLESAWNRERPKSRRTAPWGRIAVAAVLLVSLVAWKLQPTRSPSPSDPSLTIDDGNRVPLYRAEQPPPELDDRISRPATRIELALLQVAEARALRERRLRETDPLERAVAWVIGHPQAGDDELEAMLDDEEQLAGRMVGALPEARGQRRIALARLLVAIEPPDSLPVFLSLWADPLTREVVEPTLVRRADAPTLASMIRTRLPFNERVRLLSAIASRDDKQTQELLILAAMDSHMRPAALAAAQRTAPSAELLFTALSHDDADVRLAAALLLGEHSDSRVTSKLISMARRNPAHCEPWIALLQRDDAEARMIVAEARRHPQIMASVNTAAAARQMAIHPVQIGVSL